ncbi:MAG TPA: chorismate synthase [Pyrinomonadaceae bacterium]|nr:chorismate synthase [Pyrinomonadaceae bacterium]
MFFKFTTAGESHGKALVAIVEGLPSGLPVDISKINHELWRRQQGYGRGGRMKIEQDEVQILSGIRHGAALGSPVALMIENRDFVHWTDVMSAEVPDTAPKNERIVTRPRPGHADLAGGQKFGTRDLRNVLERASARETTSRVAVGAIAKQLLGEFGIEIKSHVTKLGSIPAEPAELGWDEVASIPHDSPLNCADHHLQSQMVALIDEAKENGDTLGGVFEVIAKGTVTGLGSAFSWTEKLDGRIAQAFMSIHAVKAVEIGGGIRNAGLPGSEVHDEIFPNAEPDRQNSAFARRTNRAGGLEGGITNGEELRVRGYLKPISTLKKPLQSVDINSKQPSEAAYERSDVTVVPAAGVIGESMLAIVLANALREKFGGDSIGEMKRNFASYLDEIESY